MSKKISIVGAGPGGLAAGMVLQSKGYEVDIYERSGQVGGRTSCIQTQGYTFDVGPTFLMMPFILEEVFTAAGKDYRDYMQLIEVDPMYRLIYRGKDVLHLHRQDQEKMKAELDGSFDKGYESYTRFMRAEEAKFNRILPSLRVPYSRYRDLLRKELRNAYFKLDANVTLQERLSKFFKDPDLQLAFTFQAKYLGMSPWDCPGTFSIIPYIEHSGGIFHVTGGLNRICAGMAKAFEEDGGKIHLNQEVAEILVMKGEAKGLRLGQGQKVWSDDVILNADFAHAMHHIVAKEHLKKYTPEKLAEKKYSCSIFMMYLGVSKRYDNLKHHNIYFANDYRRNVDDIGLHKKLSDDPSVYIQNAIHTDPTLAPEGKSPLYVLVPVPNNTSGIDWAKEKEPFKEKVYKLLENRVGLKDIREHIEFEKVIAPDDWEQDYYVHLGATFNLAHNIAQMLYFRPHNRFEEFDKCYLVGGGTHPGSGLPTIFQSAMISADMIMNS